MNIFNVITLFGGLAMFLYGMRLMGDGLKAIRNVRPKGVLKLCLFDENGLLHFSVYNQGDTIPTEKLKRIWTKFYRDNRSKYSGSGLGLAIVAQILSMQELSYGVKNFADGVQFYFSIPIVE